MAKSPADPLKSGLEKVERMIQGGRLMYPLASENLRHWRDGKGRTRVLPPSVLTSNSSVLAHLRSVHREKFLAGAARRLLENAVKPGQPFSMDWTDSTYASPLSDLYFALGGFTLASEVVVEATKADKGLMKLAFRSWKSQLRDSYNWDPGKSTMIPGVGRVTDDEMLAIERAGHGRSYEIRTEWTQIKTPEIVGEATISG